jgi:hypothetical protein
MEESVISRNTDPDRPWASQGWSLSVTFGNLSHLHPVPVIEEKSC